MRNFWTSLGFVFVLTGCNVQLFGTNTGNPGATTNQPNGPARTSAAGQLVAAVCQRVALCFPSADASLCEDQVSDQTGYTNQLGSTAASFATMNLLANAEEESKVTPNPSELQLCLGSIEALDCANFLMEECYSAGSPGDYSQTNLLFQSAGSCTDIY